MSLAMSFLYENIGLAYFVVFLGGEGGELPLALPLTVGF